MKKLFLLLFALQSLAIFCCNSYSQSNGWYTVKQIAEKTWLIDDRGIDNIYLLEGKDSALLIDAGFGLTNLRDFVKKITAKPIILVNTHGHPDHAGGDYQFGKAYIGYRDIDLVKYYTEPQMMKQVVNLMITPRGITVPDSLKFTDTINLHSTTFIPIHNKYVFQLGGRNVKVVDLPGHTAGSICLLDATTKYLFTGDPINKEVWLFLKESLPVEVYMHSLQKLMKIKNKFNIIYPAHGPALNKSILNELITNAATILNGQCKEEVYHSPVGMNAMKCSYKSVNIDFDPAKLRDK